MTDDDSTSPTEEPNCLTARSSSSSRYALIAVVLSASEPFKCGGGRTRRELWYCIVESCCPQAAWLPHVQLVIRYTSITGQNDDKSVGRERVEFVRRGEFSIRSVPTSRAI